MLEEEIASRGLARRPLNEDNEDQPQTKRPRQRESAAASRDPTTAEDPASASRTGGSRATSAATELRTIRVTGNDNIITRAGVSIHRRDDDWLTELLSTLRDAASKYTPDKVDKVFNVMPDWRYDDHGVLLPHQVEDKVQGLRSIGRRQASSAVTGKVLQMLADILPNHR